MLAKTRNKKLGRKLKSVIQTQPSESDVKLNKVQDTGVVFMDKVTAEEQKRLEKERFDNAVKDRVSYFCDSNRLDKCYNIVKRYAEVKMSNDEKYKWENDIHENPYKLMKVEGNGFISADKVAMGLSFPFDHKYRILAFVSKALDDNSKGSTILPLGDILVYMGKELKIGNNNRIVDVVLNQSDNTYLMLTKDYKRTTDIMLARFLTKTSWFEMERGFFNLLKELEKEPTMKLNMNIVNKVKCSFEYKLNNGQDEAINEILKSNINVLTGLGGSGKSTITKAILSILSKHRQSYTALAPTGIASKNFTKLTGAKCETVHRRFFSKSIIESDWLILEESSMLACEHIKMILSMLGDNKPRLLFIGDLNQLSPINPSAPFRDLFSLIEKGKVKGSVVELTEIMRASDNSYIPHLSKMFTKYGSYDKSVENKEHAGVYFYKLNKDLPKQILSLIGEHNLNFKNTYVLSPQKVGDFGCTKLNEYLNEVIADNTILYKDKFKTLRVNSEMLQDKNNKDLDIYNGERVTLKRKEYRNGNTYYICDRLDEGTEIIYDEDVLLNQVILSYGLTVHKTQSLTVENIILICSSQHYHMLTTNLVYTGMSRASKKLIIIHDEGVLAMASRKTEIDKRITFLGEISKR